MRGRMLQLLYCIAATLTPVCSFASGAEARPNILWITCEDTGPHLGCYGDEYAVTPNLDAFAETGVRYTACWSNAPVCAPARTTIITGMYPPSIGAQHMRSAVRLPEAFHLFPQYLREAGYYCTNNVKEDYNLEPAGKPWDESSKTAHWKNRREGQPFFAVFNHTISHESQIRNQISRRDRIHDPRKAPLPAYHPDRPEVRKDWAQYYDRVTMMDKLFAETLREMEEAGLAEDTIVFFFGDHGSGMPRHKRWPYNSGLQVPLLIRIPEKFADLRPEGYESGGTIDQLVSFVDLAPTVLGLAGVSAPEHFQGQAFAGPSPAAPRDFVYGFRDRMDERYDLIRSVRDQRYVYVRNYQPHKIYGQHLAYMFETPTARVWKQQFDLGALNDVQSRFWKTKPPEELYDLTADPDEIENLVDSPEHAEALQRLRQANVQHLLQTRDLGFLPEGEIHTRSEGSTPYEMGHNSNLYPLERILATAELASSLDPQSIPMLIQALSDSDSAVRYWGVLGLLMRGQEGFEAAHEPLIDAVEDDSEFVKIAACEALGCYSDDRDDRTQAVAVLIMRSNVEDFGIYVALAALNALDELDAKARPEKQHIARLPKGDDSIPERMRSYIPRLLEKTLADLDAAP